MASPCAAAVRVRPARHRGGVTASEAAARGWNSPLIPYVLGRVGGPRTLGGPCGAIIGQATSWKDCILAGHIVKRQRRKGYAWQARVPDPSRGGTAKIERTFRTRVEAEAWVAQQQTSILDGTWLDPRRAQRRFDSVVEVWRESWPARLEPKTIAGYDQCLRTHILPEFGHRPIGSIDREAVQRFVNRLSGGGLAAETVRGIYSVLRNALNSAVQMGAIRSSPCQKVRLPRPSRRKMLFLSVEEVDLLAAAIDPLYRVLVYTAAYTGLRAGEIAGLQRQDADVLKARLYVRRAVKEIGGTLHVGATKTHSTRSVALPGFLRDMLLDHLTAPIPGGRSPGDSLFPSPEGACLRHRNFYSRFFKPAVRAGLPEAKHGLRFHDLRHTAVSLLIEQNAPPKAIQARLGHCSIQMTMDRYGHLLPSVEDALIVNLDAAYQRAQEHGLVALPGAGASA